MAYTIWHNPRCSKSRRTLALLEAAGVEIQIRKYLDDPPSVAELNDTLGKLGMTAAQITRKKEALFKELGLSLDQAALVEQLSAHPKLIERPIVIHGDRAVMGRPPENVNALLA